MITTEVKKQKAQKMCYKKIKFENYKKCLKVTQLENKVIHLNNNKIDVK